jgi:uncharacterized membrane protein
VSAEQTLQVQLKKALVAIETKITEFDNIRQDVNKIQKYASNLISSKWSLSNLRMSEKSEKHFLF